MDLHHLPVIDWETGTKLAGNKRELAEDLLTLFVRDLQAEIVAINQSNRDKNYKVLQKQIHKLHGAICYCGLPRLKRVIEQLETNLKNNIMDHLPSHLDQLEKEIKQLLETYPPHSSHPRVNKDESLKK